MYEIYLGLLALLSANEFQSVGKCFGGRFNRGG